MTSLRGRKESWRPRLAIHLLGLGLAMLGFASACADAKGLKVASAVPADFAHLDTERELMVDVFLAGRPLGNARIKVQGSFFRLIDPLGLQRQLPPLLAPARVSDTLAGPMSTNADRVCSALAAVGCGRLEPATLGAILDEDRFRLDVFLNPGLFSRSRHVEEPAYLEPSSNGLGLTSLLGLALSKTDKADLQYNLQSRLLASSGPARLRADVAFASSLGLVADTLVAEADTNTVRYAGGILWTQGSILLPSERLAGLAFTTQLDTRVDRDSLQGTPLEVSLARPGRIELYLDSRLVSSGFHEAGTTALDTRGLPLGAYQVTMRIYEQGLQPREEKRFFIREPQLAALGEQAYYGAVGLVASSTSQPGARDRDLYAALGTRRRLSPRLAVDAGVEWRDGRGTINAGAFLAAGPFRLRGSGLLAANGDRGVALQLSSTARGPVAAFFDLRRVWSKRLAPWSRSDEPAGFTSPPRNTPGLFDLLQYSGSLSYRIGSAQVRASLNYLREGSNRADYSLATSSEWVAVQTPGLRLSLNADAERRRSTMVGYLGGRVLIPLGRAAITGTLVNVAVNDRAVTGSGRRFLGSLQGDWSSAATADTPAYQASLGLDRSVDATVVRAQGGIEASAGAARADLVHSLAGGNNTQYGLNILTTLVGGPTGVALSRGSEESALMVHVDAADRQSASYEILVDGAVRAAVRPGRPAVVLLQPYRQYKVRLRALGGEALAYDSHERTVTVFPGNIAQERWTSKRQLILFGRLVGADGSVMSNAVLTAEDGLGQSDARGLFQIEATQGSQIMVRTASGSTCSVAVGTQPIAGAGFIRLGDVECR